MSLASTWLDLVVGVDIHIELVPTPAPTPTPFPHPHCSVVFDPIGLAAAEVVGALVAMATGQPVTAGGPVLIGGRMATITGDAASMPIKHIMMPPGTAFVTGITPSDADLLVGSKTVLIRGGNAVRAGEIAMSCSEPVRMPTAAVVPTSGGPVTMIGGPPAIDFGAAAGVLGARALRTTWAAKQLHGAVDAVIPESWPRLRRLAHKSACFFTGHPVNVASGTVSTSAVDLALPGPIPLQLERDYDSNWCDRPGPLGYGWSHAFDQKLWLEPGRVVVHGGDGRELEFGTRALPGGVARRGDRVWHPVDRCTLVSHGEHRWDVEDPGGLVRRFEPIPGEPAAGRDRGMSRLVAIRDRSGHEIRLRYDERGYLVGIVDSGGRTLQLENDHAGRLRRLWAPAADGSGLRQHAEYRYDAAGDLVEVVDACGKSWQFEYDDHLLVRERDREGLAFYFQYDGRDRYARCIRTWGDGGIYDHVIDYDRQGLATVVTDSLGETTRYQMDALGMVTEITAPDGSTTRREYAPTTWLVAEIDELGAATRYTYDERGNRVMIVEPAGDAGPRVTKLRYDDHDRLIEQVEPTGATWAWRYDGAGRVTQRIDPLGFATGFIWDNGRLVGLVDPVGARTSFERDGAGNIVAITGPDGGTARRSYDALGRVVASTDVGGAVSRRQYDALGRVVRIEEPGGNVRSVVRDAEGRIVRATDRSIDVAMTYAGLGWLASRTTGGTTVRWQHDTEGRVVAVVDEAGNTHRFERDAVGRVRSEHAIGGASTRFVRDAAGRVVAEHLPGGAIVQHVYDGAGDRIQTTYAEGGVERFAYDRAGRMVRATNDDVDLVFERDVAGRVVGETSRRSDTRDPSRREIATKRGFDARGSLVGVTSTLGAAITLARDAMGDVERIVHGGAAKWEATFTRDARGDEIDRALPGGARSTWWRDAVGRPTAQLVGGGEHVHRQRNLRWGPGDRLLGITDHIPGIATIDRAFEHDARGRLVRAVVDEETFDGRFPDDTGRVFADAQRTDREYGPGGELLTRRTAAGPTVYQHDARGRLVLRIDPDGGTWRYHWNDADRLTQVDRPDGTAVAIIYDALGRRVSKNTGGERTCFVWDGERVLHQWREGAPAPEPRPLPGEAPREQTLRAARTQLHRALDADAADVRWQQLLVLAAKEFPAMVARLRREHGLGAPTKPADDTVGEVITWLFEPGSFAPLARVAASGSHAIVADQVGAPLVVLDDHGAVAAQLRLDSWGRAQVDGDASLCPWRFAGQYHDDDTGLHYNRFRYHDPDAGQYISRDPLGLRAGLRAYAYVEDPWIASDPLGLSKQPGSGCAAPQGSNNPRTRAAAVTGQEAHRQIEAELADMGMAVEVPIKTDSGYVRKDGLEDPLPDQSPTARGMVVIIKPDTPSGRAAAGKRAALMESEGYDTATILYDPLDPRFQPGSPTYIGPS